MRRLIRVLAAAMLAIPMIAIVLAPPAAAEDNGVGRTPLMGWSSWSFLRRDPTAPKVEAAADAMKASGLTDVGYRYVNLDDFWYVCPGSQGPNVDQYGRWVTDTGKFPDAGAENGIQAVADHVHGLGLKFGLYVTPGISHQAVVQNTPIEGTPYHAADIAKGSETNYNCGGMDGIDYSKPGAQAFINSWANEFASWGVDYVKLDGVGSFDIPDVQAWSDGMRQTGRPMHLELSNNLDINYASTWAKLANGWRTGSDVECYCGTDPNGDPNPLTKWSRIAARFNQAAAWAPYGGPGGFNDYDSIEVGNGARDGLTPDERRTQLSLWALAASPLVLGADLTNLDPDDLALLKNSDVIAADQDAIDATRVSDIGGQQIFAKKEPNGDTIVGLFNTTTSTQLISTSASALGLPAGTDYAVRDLWTHQTSETVGPIGVDVPAHGVALYRVRPLTNPATVPPLGVLDLTGLSGLSSGVPVSATVSFTNDGDVAAQRVNLGLRAPTGWSVRPTSPVDFAAVDSRQTVTATFQIVAPPSSQLLQAAPLSGSASYSWPGKTTVDLGLTRDVRYGPAVQPPYRIFSSATDAPAGFGQLGTQLGISGAGADLSAGTDAYSTIYQPGAAGGTSVIDTEVVSAASLTGNGKAGIIVRNDMTGSGTSPEGVALTASPSGGIQLAWSNDGGPHLNAATPTNGTIPATFPVWLRLVRNGSTYIGFSSPDDHTWQRVGSATVPAQAQTQDAGVFVTSHTSGTPANPVFDHFNATTGPVHSVTLSPATQKGAARDGADATFTAHVVNTGDVADSYTVAASGAWPATVYDSTCRTPVNATAAIQPGDTVDLCVKVNVPPAAADGDTRDTTITATSLADSSVGATGTLTTIAVTADTLVVDEDGGAPNVESYYENALTANGVAYSYWNLATDPTLPLSMLTAHQKVIWFTGNSWPNPITPYGPELATFLDGGGRLFMSGQDILDQSGGTTAFVHDYLHINWDGSEAQNDKPTTAVHGVTGNPVSDGIAAIPVNHDVLGAAYEDQITPIAPAVPAFTDDTSAPDGLSVTAGAYKAVFLAFPFEAYGTATDKADLMKRVLTYLN